MPAEVDPDAYAKMTTAAKKAFWLLHPVEGDIDIDVPGVPSLQMYCVNDDTVVKELHWTEALGWENTSLRLWTKLCGDVGQGTVVDIGAYTGIYAVVAALSAPDAAVIALDIQPVCVERVVHNAALNGVEIDVRQCAATDHAGEIVFYHGSADGIISSVASLTPNKYSHIRATSPAAPLDSAIADPSAVRLVKIDVEGAELGVLGGMKSTLSEGRPDVLIEVNHLAGLRHVAAMFPEGYSCFQIDDHAGGSIKRLPRRFRRKKGRNYLFTTRETLDAMQPT